jgi:hypothetical protein
LIINIFRSINLFLVRYLKRLFLRVSNADTKAKRCPVCTGQRRCVIDSKRLNHRGIHDDASPRNAVPKAGILMLYHELYAIK